MYESVFVSCLCVSEWRDEFYVYECVVLQLWLSIVYPPNPREKD